MDSLLLSYKGQLGLPIYLWIVYVILASICDIVMNQDFKKYNLLNNNIFLNHEIHYPFKKLITLFKDDTIFDSIDNKDDVKDLVVEIEEKYNEKCAVLARDYITFLKPDEITGENKNGDLENLEYYTKILEKLLIPIQLLDGDGNKIENKELEENIIKNVCALSEGTKELDIYPSEKPSIVFLKIILKSIGLKYISGKLKCRFKFSLQVFINILLVLFLIVYILYIYLRKEKSNISALYKHGLSFSGIIKKSSLIVLYVVITKVLFSLLMNGIPRLFHSLKYKHIICRGVDVLNLLNFHNTGDFNNEFKEVGPGDLGDLGDLGDSIGFSNSGSVDSGFDLGLDSGLDSVDSVDSGNIGVIKRGGTDDIGTIKEPVDIEAINIKGIEGDGGVNNKAETSTGEENTNNKNRFTNLLKFNKKKEKTIKEKYQDIYKKNIKWMMFILKYNNNEESLKEVGEQLSYDESGFRNNFRSFLLEQSNDTPASKNVQASFSFLKKVYSSGIKTILSFESENIKRIDASEIYNIKDKQVSILSVLIFNMFSKPGCVDRIISSIILLYIFHISIKTSNSILEKKPQNFKNKLVIYLNLLIIISIVITISYISVIILIKTFSIYVCYKIKKPFKFVSAFLEKNIINSQGIIINSSELYRLFDKTIISKKPTRSFLGLIADILFIILVIYFIVYMVLLVFIAEKSHTYKNLYNAEKKTFREHYCGVCQILAFIALACYFIYLSFIS